jgi:dTDP-4-dehydrorhamnose reductase
MLGRDLVEVLRPSFRIDDVVEWDIDEINIQEEKSTVDKIAALAPRIVINAAAYTDVDGCEQHTERAFAVNAEGVRHVALGAVKCGAKVVYLSTDYIFDGKKGIPYVENDPPNPLSVYGRSKLRGEAYVQELTKDGLIVRTQWLYGKHGKNFVNAILRQAREKGVLSVVHDQVGSPTYTVDLSRGISQLVERDARGVFHVTNSGPCSWYDYARMILELSGIKGVEVHPISSEALGRPAQRPSYSVLDTGKFKRETGAALRPWFEALKEYLSVHS